ncbi:hypothetical protein EI94DRAFT_1788751 [Lactarius quietus]|nr:hypothetical protein EI94DRAFT_1788751 [Lactarius quietus]
MSSKTPLTHHWHEQGGMSQERHISRHLAASSKYEHCVMISIEAGVENDLETWRKIEREPLQGTLRVVLFLAKIAPILKFQQIVTSHDSRHWRLGNMTLFTPRGQPRDSNTFTRRRRLISGRGHMLNSTQLLIVWNRMEAWRCNALGKTLAGESGRRKAKEAVKTTASITGEKYDPGHILIFGESGVGDTLKGLQLHSSTLIHPVIIFNTDSDLEAFGPCTVVFGRDLFRPKHDEDFTKRTAVK